MSNQENARPRNHWEITHTEWEALGIQGMIARVEHLEAISHENAPYSAQKIPGDTMTPTTGFIPTEPQRTPLAPLIALGGKLRAGKDAVGDYLEWEYGYTKLGMSDALNKALLALNPIIPTGKYWEAGYEHYMTYQDYHAAHGYVEAKKNPEVRRLLQVLGTEVGRNMIDADVWVNIAERKIQELRTQGIPVVITAIRFPNELEMVRRLGGTSIWIERPTEARTDADEGIQAHASETSVDESMFDTVIHNDTTLDDLYGNVENVLDMD